MGWPAQVAIVAVVLVLSLAAIFAGAIVLGRVFKFLGSIVDEWRPTPTGEARPGHERLGVGVVCVTGPVIAIFWYDLAAPLVALPGSLPYFTPTSVLALVVVLILTPAIGLWCLLNWKNARLEFKGALVRETTSGGQTRDWEMVQAASMQRPIRDAGAVYFELANRSIRTDTNWVNIRDAYEGLARAGVRVDPWEERTHKGKGAQGRQS